MKLDYSDAPECVKNFLTYKSAIQNRSKKTVFQYYHDLRTFARYLLTVNYPDKFHKSDLENIEFSCADDDLLLAVKKENIFNFVSFLVNDLDNGVAARQRKLSCLKGFYKYHQNIKLDIRVKNNPTDGIEAPSKPRRLPKHLTLEESKQLLESVDGNNKIRDYCIVTLFLNCGMRVSELVGLNLSSFDTEFNKVNVIGKGDKERIIYLNSACKNSLKEYLEIRCSLDVKNEDKDALFISRNHNRISVQTVQWLINKHLKYAGLGNLNMSVHKLRHTAATIMYQHGKTDVRVLKDILGHEQLSTTQIYTHISDKMMREAMDDNPLANIKRSKIKKETFRPQDEEDDDDD